MCPAACSQVSQSDPVEMEILSYSSPFQPQRLPITFQLSPEFSPSTTDPTLSGSWAPWDNPMRLPLLPLRNTVTLVTWSGLSHQRAIVYPLPSALNTSTRNICIAFSFTSLWFLSWDYTSSERFFLIIPRKMPGTLGSSNSISRYTPWRYASISAICIKRPQEKCAQQPAS